MELVEREHALATLEASIKDAAAGEGRLVLISGEAGAGKTSLIRAAAGWGLARVLWGNCDGLLTPRPLGPLLDAVESGPRLLSSAASRHEVFSTVLQELSWSQGPTLLVIEDAHWADGASTDLLRYLARRVERTNGVLAVTYRDDDVDPAHPLRLLLGDVGHGTAVRRIRLPALSRQAVSTLAAAVGADSDEIYRLSGGNPYVVSELLADPAGAVHSVRDAVMTRAAQLPAAGRAVLEAASVMSEGAEPAVLIRVATGTGGLDACVAAGLLIQDGVVIRFRHELARQVTEAGLTPERRAALHSDVLAALLASGLGEPARCVHHAEAAGDVAQVLRFSRLAADRAIALGSHREATAQLERALRFTVGDQPETLIERGELLDQLSEQYLLRDRSGEAHRVHDEALGIWRAVGDPARLGACLRRRAEVLRYSDNGTGSIEAAQSAVELLRPLGEGPQLARALASLAQALMLAERSDQAVSVAEQAIEMAELFGQEQTRAHALATLGSARALAGEEAGLAQIAAGAAGSRAAGFDADSVRATSNLVSSQLLYDQVQGLRPIIEAEVDFAAERGMESHVQCMRVALATVYLRTGKWDEAGEIAQAVMRFGTAAAQRIEPLILIGTLRARRGDPAPEVPLDEALRSALRIGEPQLIYPAHRALAELAWLTGQSDSAARHAATARAALAHAPRHPLQSEAAYWCFRAGIPGPELLSPQHPFALQAAGRPAEAARLWNAMGFPYHEADALADSLDEADQRRAWTLFESLGVGSRAAGIARRLRAVGAKDLPRRPHAASRANPAGLTDRQLEIAGLIAAHLTNQEIAERLYLSPRTVDHHVSAILGKLEVGNRRHAAQRCQDLGIPAG